MTAAEHLAWCKEQALEFLDRGECGQAVLLFVAEMDKHPETRLHKFLSPFFNSWLDGFLPRASQIRDHIEGFN